MYRNVVYHPIGFDSQNSLQSLKDKCSKTHLSFDDLYKVSLFTSNIDLYHFTESAEKILKDNSQINTYTMMVFEIDQFNELHALYGNSLAHELIACIRSSLKRHIKEPNLYSNVNENFILLLENYKSVDIAMLVIQLSEEIACLYPKLSIKLTFGICIAGPTDRKISYLYKRALYAKSTIKGQNQQLLANYTELILRKRSMHASHF